MEEEAQERRPKRQKRESSYKAKAFEKFKQLKSGNKNKYDEDEVDNLYEIVDEKEYTKKVLARQDDDWIVDDDGSGYVEDGRDIFDDDLDQESIAAAASSRGKGVKRKKKAVSASAGKGNLQYLLSNMPSKKKEEEKLGEDDALSELLGELDEAPNTSSFKSPRPKPMASPLSTKLAEKDYMKSLNSVVLKVKPKSEKICTPKSEPPKKLFQNGTSAQKSIKLIEDDSIVDQVFASTQQHVEIKMESPQNADKEEETPSPEVETMDCFDDDLDFSQIEESKVESQPPLKVENEALQRDWTDIQDDMMKDWGTNFDDNNDLANIKLENSDIPLVQVESGDVTKKVFRFFWWDAFEDSSRQPGVVFLFGKTFHERTKSYVSCCVAVRNIDRKIFFLPRQVMEGTDQAVTAQDVYSEVNNSVMKGLNVKNFRSRPISKKYCFDPEIPAESDYVEVRYPATDPAIPRTREGKTFSHVFGTETSFLETLLLDCKIKGPCWLDITNPSPVTNPFTWCKLEVNCNKLTDISLVPNMTNRPPLVVTSINLKRAINPKTSANEIIMISCVTNVDYSVDKQIPAVAFQTHFCVFTGPEQQALPLDLHQRLSQYKATTVQKMNSEKAVLNFFITKFALLDPDLIVGHDLQGHQISILCDRLVQQNVSSFSKLGRLKRTILVKQKLERELFTGRLVCDVKISAKELIKSRSYDLDALCQSVLKIPDGQRVDFEAEDVPRMFQTSGDVLKLISLTMQDTAHVLKIMYHLNIVPLALQITNIAGNVMSRTLMGGRSERNEFLLLHAFTEKGFIPPDKVPYKKSGGAKRGKPSYSGGLVLDPKVGFYDSFILLMDFNSLYPSIIQEYNICFTTMPPDLSEDNMVLPDKNLPAGILPNEIRKLVESRRQVKQLMNSDISQDLRIQYHIRQMALKLTANSMYGCLGFSNSRFYAKSLAALITHKGREILTNTRDLVQKLNYDVIYGDTDSIMINTMITDYEQVWKIGYKIKQEINKLYRQVELDIDGVFKYLLLLKKKKYAAVVLSKTKGGDLKAEPEYKGLDIVRRDWSRLASEAGKFVLGQILSDQSGDDRVNNIYNHLRKLKEDLQEGKVPITLLTITKQLTKNPNMYPDANSLSHVQVALRYNRQSGGHLRAGDTVPYVICEDGSTDKSATQRAYHVEELKTATNLKIDVIYYLSQQIFPVVSRICEPIEEIDLYQLAECLGVETIVKTHTQTKQQQSQVVGENITRPEVKFRNVDKFVFKCYACKGDNTVDGPFRYNAAILEKCANDSCKARPIEYIASIQNQLIGTINSYVRKYYSYDMYCEDPMCTNETPILPVAFSGRYPVCTMCQNAVMLKKYSENQLYSQIAYFQYIFDLTKLDKRPILDYQVEKGYSDLKELVENRLEYCDYAYVNLASMFSLFSCNTDKAVVVKEEDTQGGLKVIDFEVDDDFDDEESESL